MSSSKFHYTECVPPPTVYEHVNALNGLNSESCHFATVNLFIGVVSGRVVGGFSILQSFVNFIALCLEQDTPSSQTEEMVDALALLYGFELPRMKTMHATFSTILHSFMSKSLTDDNVHEDLSQLGMNKDKITQLIKLIGKSHDDSQVVSEKINKLVNLEWKFGVTAASSELDRVGATFLQLKLSVLDAENCIRNIHMELSLSQFYKFLHELERAKVSLESLG